ncbi:carbon-nitrogen hydrolase family protein [Ferviditalea candida]|uniref:Carbon-nitrogen hydrolase family protein n=1 Tax=Ferviditalea candida TaxID=3108399 RepID=A0ABU5ZMZ9_9BACL|nr:carbon-nitrogen hydrolase family protein [Paenibacillaceae bacterium T2]
MNVKLFLAQMEPILYDKQANLEKMHRFMQQAAQGQADLILFPELCLTGYFTRDRTAELSEDETGSSIQQVADWARQFKLMTVFGFPERRDGLIYNSACLINHDGSILGTYQKIHLWDEESKYFSSGESFHVWDTEMGRIGIMICYDTEFPETARILALKGAEIILAPTANMSPFEHAQSVQIQCRAVENQVFVATTNRIGTEESTRFFGESSVADPFGKHVLLGNQEEKGYLVQIDLTDLNMARRFPKYLDDRRPELYANLAECD